MPVFSLADKRRTRLRGDMLKQKLRTAMVIKLDPPRSRECFRHQAFKKACRELPAF
jgi:hypothetical protein